MKHKQTNRLDVCHSIGGRLRVRAPAVRATPFKSKALQHYLLAQDGIKSAEARPITGSIIILYDPDQTDPASIMEILHSGVEGIEDLPVLPDDATIPISSRGLRSEEQKPPLLGALKVIAFTGFMVYYLVRTWVLKSPFSSGWMTAATVFGSLSLFRRAIVDIRHGQYVSVNLFLSSASVLALTTGQPAAALETAWIREIGQLLEDYVQDRSLRQIRETLIVSARKGYVLIDDNEIETPIERIRSGDTVVIHPTERIPVDGSVVEGEALVDEAHITGRAEPEHRKAGDPVYAGTIINSGIVKVRADQVGENTYLSRIIKSVEESLANRSEAEKKADLLAARLTVLGLVCTVATALLTRDLAKTLSVQLAMSSPCATVLAASTAVTAALANASRNRVLIKGGLYLERFHQIDCFCFDKTGTVTSEEPSVVQVFPALPNTNPHYVLQLAADAQSNNPHPIAKSLIRNAVSQGHVPRKPSQSEIELGRGIRSTIDEHRVVVGNLKLMEQENIDVSSFTDTDARLENRGQTSIYVAQDGVAEGLIGMAYSAKPELFGLIKQLKSSGVKEIYLVSGDKHEVVRTVAKEHGFDGYQGNLLPEQKADYMERLGAQGRNVAMVGDGINDALALSKARIGIAMGAGGAEAAIEAADIALVDSNLNRLVYVGRLSEQSLKVIEQNHWFAITTDVLGAVLGMLGYISPVASGLTHILHTFVIVLNSSRLLAWRLPAEMDTTAPFTQDLKLMEASTTTLDSGDIG